MKKRRRSQNPKRDERSDEEDIAKMVSAIKDDGSHLETSVGEGDDVPTSEINAVIKKLKLDRFSSEGEKLQKIKKVQKDKKVPERTKGKQTKQMQNDTTVPKDEKIKAAKSKEQKQKTQKLKTKKLKKSKSDQVKSSQPGPTFEEDTGASKTDDDAVVKQQVVHQQSKTSPIHLQFTKTSTMLLPIGVKWYNISSIGKIGGSHSSSEGIVNEYRNYTTQLYDNEISLHAARKKSEVGSQSKWMQTVVKSGALSDKVAALTLEVQGAPIHSPLSLDALLAMVRKKGRREALLGLDAVKRLFLEELLPSNRKLQTFSKHPFEELERKVGSNRSSRDKQLLLWYHEDQLKQKYEILLQIIEKMMQDTVSAVKSKALSVCYELLVNRPEQEKKLLRLIVNKVGDPDYKVAAKAVHWLQKLVDVHSMMKNVVVQGVEELLYRPNISTKAQYYAICFLNQLVLMPEETNLATQLIVVYLSFFRACTKQKKIDNKMLSAVITGVHRAFPYSKGDEKVHEQLNTLFKVIHKTTFNTSIQALMLVKQVLDNRQSTMDRFYSSLYRKLLDPQLSNSPRHAMFLNLLYQTLKEDEVIRRVKAFVKRLLQVCSWQQPPFIAAVLVLVSELVRSKPSLGVFKSWSEDSDEEHFVDVDEDEEHESKGLQNGEKPLPKSTSHKLSSDKKSSWVHRQGTPDEVKDKVTNYDALARNPLHSQVDDAIMWELKVLSIHYHPSVALFASQLLAGSIVSYTGNPLQDFTPTRFLDRFVYRNPKQKLVGKESVMQPKSRSYKPPAIRNMPVNSEDFTKLTESSIPIDEIFFHKFFSQKDQKGKKSKDVKKGKLKVKDEQKKEKEEEEEEEEKDEEMDVKGDAESPDDFDSEASSVDDEEFDRILDEMVDNVDEDEDDDIDFAGEFQKKPTKRSKKRKKEEEEEDDSSDEDDEEDEDEDIDDETGQSEDTQGLDEEAFEMSDEDGADNMSGKASKRKRRKADDRKAKRQKGPEALTDVTEKISSMIDQNVGSKFDVGLSALSNKDKADMKQLKWEMDRDRWVRGMDSKSRMRAKKVRHGPKAKGFKGRRKGKQK